MKMICIHHAGGSAYSYSNFKRNLSDYFDVMTIELPGRGTLVNEKLTTDCSKAIDGLLNQLKNCVEPYEEYILFGHSMGAWLAYGLCCELDESKEFYPSHLILSGNNPPYLKHEPFDPDNYSDDEFIKIICGLGGIPDQLLKNEILLNFYIGVLRADYKLMYYFTSYIEKKELKCGISVLRAYNDSVVNDIVNEWKEVAPVGIEIFEFEGNHFSLYDKNMNESLKQFLCTHKFEGLKLERVRKFSIED